MSDNEIQRGGFQTKRVLAALLEEAGLAPRHRFGQNFLIDRNLMMKLVESAELQSSDCVLEIGTGTGSLTSLIAERAGHVVSVDIDPGVQGIARNWLENRTNVEFILADAMEKKSEISPEVLANLGRSQQKLGGEFKLVSNLPYDVATPVIVNLLAGEPRFSRLCFTVQQEVGERFLAAPNTSDYGPISILTQVLAEGHRVARVPLQAFWPAPKVTSVMLRLDVRADAPASDRRGFAQFVRTYFQHRRKTMLSIAKGLGDAGWISGALERMSVSTTARPEVITPEQWLRLFQAHS